MRRELISIGEDMVNVAYDAPVDVRAARADRGGRAPPLSSSPRPAATTAASSASRTRCTTAIDMAARRLSSATASSRGISTGLADLDRMMGGLQPSDLVILAGRPGMGKTALATNIAFNIAKAYAGERAARRHDRRPINGGIVGFFSLEMSAEQLATRIIAEQSGVASYKIRRGDITEDDFDQHRRRRARDADDPALHRPDRRHLDRAARRARPAAEAPARASTSWSSTTSSCSSGSSKQAARTACRNSPRSPPA